MNKSLSQSKHLFQRFTDDQEYEEQDDELGSHQNIWQQDQNPLDQQQIQILKAYHQKFEEEFTLPNYFTPLNKLPKVQLSKGSFPTVFLQTIDDKNLFCAMNDGTLVQYGLWAEDVVKVIKLHETAIEHMILFENIQDHLIFLTITAEDFKFSDVSYKSSEGIAGLIVNNVKEIPVNGNFKQDYQNRIKCIAKIDSKKFTEDEENGLQQELAEQDEFLELIQKSYHLYVGTLDCCINIHQILFTFNDQGESINQVDIITDEKKILEHDDKLVDLAVNEYCLKLISSSQDGECRVWSLETFDYRLLETDNDEIVVQKVVSTQYEYIYTISSDSKIRMWNVETGLLEKTFAGHFGDIFNISSTPYGEKFVSCGSDKKVKIWDQEKTCEEIILSQQTTTYFVLIKKNGKEIITIDDDCYLKQWKIERAEVLLWYGNQMEHLEIDPQEQDLVSVEQEYYQQDEIAFKIQKRSRILTDQHIKFEPKQDVILKDMIFAIKISPDGQYFAVGQQERILIMDYQLFTIKFKVNTKLNNNQQKKVEKMKLEFMRNTNYLVQLITYEEREADLIIWNLQSHEISQRLTNFRTNQLDFLVLNDHEKLILSSGQWIKIFDLRIFEEQKMYNQKMPVLINKLAVSDDEKIIAIAGKDKKVTVWYWENYSINNSNNLEKFVSFSGHSKNIDMICFVRDNYSAKILEEKVLSKESSLVNSQIKSSGVSPLQQQYKKNYYKVVSIASYCSIRIFNLKTQSVERVFEFDGDIKGMVCLKNGAKLYTVSSVIFEYGFYESFNVNRKMPSLFQIKDIQSYSNIGQIDDQQYQPRLKNLIQQKILKKQEDELNKVGKISEWAIFDESNLWKFVNNIRTMDLHQLNKLWPNVHETFFSKKNVFYYFNQNILSHFIVLDQNKICKENLKKVFALLTKQGHLPIKFQKDFFGKTPFDYAYSIQENHDCCILILDYIKKQSKVLNSLDNSYIAMEIGIENLFPDMLNILDSRFIPINIGKDIFSQKFSGFKCMLSNQNNYTKKDQFERDFFSYYPELDVTHLKQNQERAENQKKI